MDSVTSKQIREARDLFHALLSKKTKESEWQKLFAEHPYVITPSLPLRLEPKDIIPMGRPGRTEPDFIFYPQGSSPVNFYGVIELKKPDQRIASITRKNLAILSRDAETAVEQANQYIHQVPSLLSTKLRGGHLFLGNNQYLFVLMGLSENELIFRQGNEFYREMIQDKLPGNLQILPYDIVLRNFEQIYYQEIYILVPTQPQLKGIKLRSEASEFSSEDMIKRCREINLFDRKWNWTSTGIKHRYEVGNKLFVLDHATNLLWLREGSSSSMSFEKAVKWIKNLNCEGYAGYNDWRLPTLDEAMSLMEPAKNKEGLYIDSIFDSTRRWIWTSDKVQGTPWSWIVFYDLGGSDDSNVYFSYYLYFVRAVRSV